MDSELCDTCCLKEFCTPKSYRREDGILTPSTHGIVHNGILVGSRLCMCECSFLFPIVDIASFSIRMYGVPVYSPTNYERRHKGLFSAPYQKMGTKPS